MGELKGFKEGGGKKKGVCGKGKDLEKLGDRRISFSQHQYPAITREAERNPWILKAGDVHAAFWKHPLGQ